MSFRVLCFVVLCFTMFSVGPVYAEHHGETEISNGWKESALEAIPMVVEKYAEQIKIAGEYFGIPPRIIAAIIITESLGNKKARNGKAKGLMQTRPVADKETKIKCNSLRAVCSIKKGAAYLSIIKYGNGLQWTEAIHAYNAGPFANTTREQSEYSEYVDKISFVLGNLPEYKL